MAESSTVTIHLSTLKSGTSVQQLDLDEVLAKGVPHGWVHPPVDLDRDMLTKHDWDLFLLTDNEQLPAPIQAYVETKVSFQIDLASEQYDALQAKKDLIPKPSDRTPPLAQEFREGRIPNSAVVDDRNDSGPAALPTPIANKPVSLFNLFKYKDSRAVHDAYMEGFKQKFGDAAGASVQFMGPVRTYLEQTDERGTKRKQLRGTNWEDANLVQYDTIWHYVYMLSTDIYAELNKQKVAGLDDTCILVVSEIELCK
ncbi:hypothetical protein LTS14_001703 [Recurvomyces mirabilis]|uniref:uncharacterized protein n=1 Tax=Recurvomyces mirabilis TaxID=574656 RepID=UPI002DDF6888|nr:hypothetical protein LTS14_001703 [Recurvomyces mirabilis]